MTATAQRFAKIGQLLNANAQPRVKTEFDFIKEAIVENKAQRSGVMKLAWYYIKKKGLSFKVAINKAWDVVRERIAQIAKAVRMEKDLSAWGKIKFD